MRDDQNRLARFQTRFNKNIPEPAILPDAFCDMGYEGLTREAIPRLEALRARSASFSGIVRDYLHAVRSCTEYQVQVAQLRKEADELRCENDHLLGVASSVQRRAAEEEELTEARERIDSLQRRLIEAHDDAKAAVKAKDEALSQLEIVRESHARQAAEIDEMKVINEKIREELNERKDELVQMEAEREQIVSEVKAKNERLQEEQDRADYLDAENRDLVQRIIELKDSEAEKMNKMNEMAQDIIREAQRKASDIMAKAEADAAQVSRASTSRVASEGTAILDDKQLGRHLDILPEDGIMTSVPKAVSLFFPAAHNGECRALAPAPSGSTFASCGADMIVHLWNAAGATKLGSLRGSTAGLNDVSYTSDGRFLLGAEDRASGQTSAAVRVWDTRSHRLTVSLVQHRDKVTGVATSVTDPGEAYSCSADRSIKIWKLQRGTLDRSLLHPSKATRLTVLPDTGQLVTGHVDGNVRFWDPRTRNFVNEIVGLHGTHEVLSVTVANRGGRMLTCSRDRTMCLIDTRMSCNVLARLAAPTFLPVVPWAVPALSPCGYFAVAGGSDGTLFVWDLHGDSVEKPTSAARFGAAISDSSRQHEEGYARPTARLRHHNRVPQEQRNAGIAVACWSPTGAPVITGDKRGGVALWGHD